MPVAEFIAPGFHLTFENDSGVVSLQLHQPTHAFLGADTLEIVAARLRRALSLYPTGEPESRWGGRALFWIATFANMGRGGPEGWCRLFLTSESRGRSLLWMAPDHRILAEVRLTSELATSWCEILESLCPSSAAEPAQDDCEPALPNIPTERDDAAIRRGNEPSRR
jgi:hypothetical protein